MRLLIVLFALGCSSPSTPSADASLGVCQGKVGLYGEYVDWNSSEQSFLGVFEAEVSGSSITTFSTPPNGRMETCSSADATTVVTALHPDYLPMSMTLYAPDDAENFTARGLKTSERQAFESELGVSLSDVSILLQVLEGTDAITVTGCQSSFIRTNDSWIVGNVPMDNSFPFIFFTGCATQPNYQLGASCAKTPLLDNSQEAALPKILYTYARCD